VTCAPRGFTTRRIREWYYWNATFLVSTPGIIPKKLHPCFCPYKPTVCVPLRRNGKGTGRESKRDLYRVMGTGREPGIFL